MFAAILKRFFQGDPAYVARFLDIWQRTPGQPDAKLRWSYRMDWNEPGIGLMRFHGFVSSANEPDGLSFNDWIPLDAATWERLALLKERAGAPGQGTPATGTS